MRKKICVLIGSPRKKGNTVALLVERHMGYQMEFMNQEKEKHDIAYVWHLNKVGNKLGRVTSCSLAALYQIFD